MSELTLTPVEKKPLSFALPVIGAAGALAGLFVGTAHGSGLLGIVLGAAVLMGIAFVAIEMLGKDMERPVRWGIVALFTLAGIALAGVPGVVLGILLGWFFSWFIYWIGEGRYRAKLQPYLTPGEVLWHYGFHVLCGAIFVFLITPILVVIPLSFNAENFFTFTPEMLRFDPAGYSLKHYEDFFTSSGWQQALRDDPHFLPGLNVHAGKVTYQAVAKAFDLESVDPASVVN